MPESNDNEHGIKRMISNVGLISVVTTDTFTEISINEFSYVDFPFNLATEIDLLPAHQKAWIDYAILSPLLQVKRGIFILPQSPLLYLQAI